MGTAGVDEKFILFGSLMKSVGDRLPFFPRKRAVEYPVKMETAARADNRRKRQTRGNQETFKGCDSVGQSGIALAFAGLFFADIYIQPEAASAAASRPSPYARADKHPATKVSIVTKTRQASHFDGKLSERLGRCLGPLRIGAFPAIDIPLTLFFGRQDVPKESFGS